MSAVGEAFLLFEQASEHPDPTVAREMFVQVLAMQRQLGGDLELDERQLPLAATLGNIATLSQELEDWPAMRDAAGEAREHTMHAIALKRLGDREGAATALARAIAEGPDEVSPLHELACQRLAANDRAGALEAITLAMANGADPEALREDTELAALAGDPRFEQLLGREHYVASLVALLAREHADLAETVPDAEEVDAWLDDDDTLDAFDEAIDLAERLVDAAALDDVPSLPIDPGGTEVLDVAACDATQVAVIEALLAAEHFWHALPFLIVLGQHRIPSVSPDDARERLGLA